jgi:hypothetical protein
MAVPRASGVPDYGPGAGTSNFLPEIYSGKLVEKFYKTTVFGEIATTEYEGDIAGFGAQVVIRTVPTISVTDYVIGAGLTTQYPSRNSVTLAIDQAKSFNVALNTVDTRQSDLDLADIFAEDGSIQLKISADQDMLETIPAQVSSENTGNTAGADSANIKLGTAVAPIQVVATGATGVQQNIVNYILNCAQVLDEQSVTDQGRWIVLPPWLINLLKQSPLQIASLAGDSVSILRNGKVGMIDRFTVYESRNTLRYNSPENSWAILFGHSAGLAFAAQIVEAQMIDNPDDFGYLIRGLMVFGFRVIEPLYVGCGFVRQ